MVTIGLLHSYTRVASLGLGTACWVPVLPSVLYEEILAMPPNFIKRILRHDGYPPDLQAIATETVVQQADLFASEI